MSNSETIKLPDELQKLCDLAMQARAEKQERKPVGQPTVCDSALVDRARAYLAKMPAAISGQGGHNQTLSVARVLVHDFALSETDAWALLNEYNALCQPPWSEKELRHKLNEALKLSQAGQCERAFGNLRNASIREQGADLTGFIAGTKAQTVADETVNTTRFGPGTKSLSELLDDPELLKAPPRIATGFSALDAALEGGLVQNGLYALAGLTGRGKSTLCANLARNMASAPREVLYFSLEDCDVQAVRKLLAQQSQVAVRALSRFHEDGAVTQAEYQRVQSALGQLRPLPLYLNSSDCELAHIERIIELGKPNVVLIDQSSWVSVPGSESAFTEASEISRRLKQLAKRLDIPVVALVQINRAGASAMREGQDLELYHIRDSGRWEQDADGVFIIQRVEDQPDGWSLMCLDIKKNRHDGGSLRVHLKARLACALVEDSPDHRLPVKIGEEAKVKESTDARITPAAFASEYFTVQPIAPGVVRVKAKGKLSGREIGDLIAASVAEGHLHPWKRGKETWYATVNQPEEIPCEPTIKRRPGRPKKGETRGNNSK